MSSAFASAPVPPASFTARSIASRGVMDAKVRPHLSLSQQAWPKSLGRTFSGMPKLDQKPDPVAFARRLNEAMSDRGIEERGRGADLARRHRVSQPTSHAWLNGGHLPGPSRVTMMARDYGVRFEWLYFGRPPKAEPGVTVDAAADDLGAEDVEVPLWAARGSSGGGAINDDARVIGTLTFKRRSLDKKSIPSGSANVFYVDGDSMLPRLHDGDAVLFNEADTSPRDGKIFVVHWNGHEYVKRLRFYDGRWHISSDNKANPEWRDDKPISDRDQFNVIGRVRWIASWED